MTVKEFIEKLQDFPQDYEIIVDGDFCCCPIEHINFDIFDEGKTVYME
jgi:hypothetical protein